MNVIQEQDQEQDSFDNHLIYLQAEAFNVIALFAGILGYSGLIWITWSGDEKILPEMGIGSGLLLACTLLSYTLKVRHLTMASTLVIGGILAFITCLAIALPSLDLHYLFIVPIIFSSVLLGQQAIFWATGAASILLLAVTLFQTQKPLYFASAAAPVLALVLVALAAWLSSRNLYTALAWVINSYEQARCNEQLARERQAELKRVLKDLDAATYTVERTNHMLRLARDQAEEARRLKQQFAQNISHELRTPLNLIVGFTETMLQSPEYYGEQLPFPYLRDLSIVYRNACHLQSLVHDVLDLARIEAAQMSLLPEEVDIAVLVEEAVETARSLVETRGLTLYTEIDPHLPHLWIDPVRIRQVLFNLLNNAARFTEKGSVTVSVRHQGDDVVFAVKDTGIGIAPKDIPRVFEAFHQVDGSMQRRQGGAGLGLTISKHFVELHGGRIWLESQVGEGSTFYFSLPVNSAVQTGIVERCSFQVAREIATGWNQAPILLAITRSPSAATMLSRYLRKCRTIVVPNLEQARLVAQQMIPQVVLVDTTSEALDTTIRLVELAEKWVLRQTPFVACPLPGEERLRQQLAANGYLIKPVTRESLWDVLRQFGEDVDKILVVDDDRDFVRLMSRLLDNPLRRYRVFTAYGGQEALAIARRLEPDLILLDLKLPDIDGFQVIERIRADAKRKDIPIVIVSAQDEIDTLETLNGPMFINKSGGFAPGEVVRWIQSVLDMAITSSTQAG